MTPHALPKEEGDIVEELREAANGMRGFDNERGDFGLCDTAADEIERLRSLIPALTDHAAIDALAQRAGVHRGAVFAVIKAMQEAA